MKTSLSAGEAFASGLPVGSALSLESNLSAYKLLDNSYLSANVEKRPDASLLSNGPCEIRDLINLLDRRCPKHGPVKQDHEDNRKAAQEKGGIGGLRTILRAVLSLVDPDPGRRATHCDSYEITNHEDVHSDAPKSCTVGSVSPPLLSLWRRSAPGSLPDGRDAVGGSVSEANRAR